MNRDTNVKVSPHPPNNMQMQVRMAPETIRACRRKDESVMTNRIMLMIMFMVMVMKMMSIGTNVKDSTLFPSNKQRQLQANRVSAASRIPDAAAEKEATPIALLET